MKEYSKGSYNKYDDIEQWIRISEGCPNNCEYCRETKENGTKPIIYEIPEIIRNKVKIMDMNLIYKSEALEIIRNLGQRRANGKVIYYELICGIDFRYMTQELASALKKSRFENIRLAWDHKYEDVYKIKKVIDYLLFAGYSNKNIQVFMVCNWKYTFNELCAKLETLKYWNIQVSDCWFDNQLPPNIKPIYWSEEEIKSFRKQCRDHNIRIRFNGIQTEKSYINRNI